MTLYHVKDELPPFAVTCKVKSKLSYEHLEDNMDNVETRFVNLFSDIRPVLAIGLFRPTLGP